MGETNTESVIAIPATSIQESIAHLSKEYALDIRTATTGEYGQVTGISRSRNSVAVVIVDDEVALLKKYKSLSAFGASPEKRASIEVDCLQYLESTGSDLTPRVLSERMIAMDGTPTVAIKYETGFVPFSSIISLLRQELTSENSRTDYLVQMFSKVKELHQYVAHGDLHLDNIGLIPPDKTGAKPNFKIIDLETATKKIDVRERKWWYSTNDDLVNLMAHTLFNVFNGTEYDSIPSQVKQRLFDKLKQGYFDGSDGQEMPENYLSSGIVERYNEVPQRLDRKV